MVTKLTARLAQLQATAVPPVGPEGCLPVVVAQHNKCPTCARPFGAQPVVERGRHVRGAPTFVLPK